MYFSIGILALVKFICIFLSWIVKGIIVCFMYVGFGLFFILRQIFRFFVYTIREIGYGIAQCFSYVNKRLRHEFYLALRIVGACVLVGAVGFQIFHATHKKQDKGQQIVKTTDQYISGASPLILFAAPGINVMSSESVTSGTSPPGLIQMKPAVADSFQYYQPIASCVTPACGGCVTPACPRLCAVPEKVVPKTNDIYPCLLTATIRRTWGRGIGLDDDYTTIAQRLFPIEIGNNIWPFLDVRLHGFDNGELGANIGLGYRHFSSCSQNAFGMNIYYDFRETSRHTRFSQFGIGFEILGKCWDLRVNGYIPIRETRLIKTCLWTYTGGYFVEKKKYQEAKTATEWKVFALSEEDRPSIMALYDGAVRNLDMEIERHVRKLEELGILDDTLIIITPDHGEEILERGSLGHASCSMAGTLYDENIRIPLIMRYPKALPQGRVIETQVSQVDIMPTIFDILGYSMPELTEGHSLLPLIKGKDIDFEEETHCETLVCGIQTLDWDKRIKWAVRTPHKKLIYSQDPVGNYYELYNLKNDPEEKVNLIDKEPKISNELKKKLRKRKL